MMEFLLFSDDYDDIMEVDLININNRAELVNKNLPRIDSSLMDTPLHSIKRHRC